MANIRVFVKAFPVLKDYVEFIVEDDTRVSDLVGILARKYSDFREHYLNDEGHLEIDVVVMVNNKTTRDWGLILRDGDRVLFIPPVAGG